MRLSLDGGQSYWFFVDLDKVVMSDLSSWIGNKETRTQKDVREIMGPSQI